MKMLDIATTASKMALVFLASFGLICTAGCAGQNAAVTSEGTIASDESAVVETAAKAVPVSEAFASQERKVWFRVFDRIGKDSEIYEIYVVENGQVTTYMTHNFFTSITLGDIAGKSDDSIVKYCEEGIAALKEKYPTHGPWSGTVTPSFVVQTDQTGNNVISEVVDLGSIVIENSITLNGNASHSGVVYDDTFVGFDAVDTGDRPRYVITRDSGVDYCLDTVDTPGVMVD